MADFTRNWDNGAQTDLARILLTDPRSRDLVTMRLNLPHWLTINVKAGKDTYNAHRAESGHTLAVQAAADSIITYLAETGRIA